MSLAGGTLQAAAGFSSTKGFTSNFYGSINTNGFNVAFSGSNAGRIYKTGSGTLTLSNPTVGNIYIYGGTLDLPNAASGNLTPALSYAATTIVASGTLTSVLLGATLDLVDSTTGRLVVEDPLEPDGSGSVIDFGVGSDSDLLTLNGSLSSIAVDSFMFNFTNFGGAQTGVNYPLIDLPTNFIAPSTNLFAFDSAPGWAGTFSTTANTVSVNFTSVPAAVPEPGTLALLAVATAAIIPRLRRSKRNSRDRQSPDWHSSNPA